MKTKIIRKQYEFWDVRDILDEVLNLWKRKDYEELKNLSSQYPQYRREMEMIIGFYEQLKGGLTSNN